MEFLTQPIRRSTMIEEVGESLVPEGSLADGTRRMGSSGDGRICGASGAAAISGEGRICSAVQAAAVRRDS